MPAAQKTGASGRSARKSAMNNPFCPTSPKGAGSKPTFPSKTKAATPKAKAKSTPAKATTPKAKVSPAKAKESAAKAKASAAKAKASAAKVSAAKAKVSAAKAKASAAKVSAAKAKVSAAKAKVSAAKAKLAAKKEKASPAKKAKPVVAKKVVKKAVSPVAKTKKVAAKKTASPISKAKKVVATKAVKKAQSPVAKTKKVAAKKAPSPVTKAKKVAAKKAIRKAASPVNKAKKVVATKAIKKAITTKGKAVVRAQKKTSVTPQKKAPATPKKRPETPTRKPETSRKRPGTPTKKPETPKKRPATPVKRPETPSKRPATPVKRPETPSKRLATPKKRLETPVKKAEMAQKRLGTPKKETQKETAKPSREERLKQRTTKDTDEKPETRTQSPRGAAEVQPKKRAASQSPRGSERKKQVVESKKEPPSTPEKVFDMKIKMKTYDGKKRQAGKEKASKTDAGELEAKVEPEEPEDKSAKVPVLPPLDEAPRKIICLDCGEPFLDRKSLTTHKRTDCNSIFPTRKGTTTPSELSQKVVMCGQCGLNCASKEAFLLHSESCQKQAPKDDKLRKCNYCYPPIWFPGFPLFLNHMRDAHNLKQGHNLFMCNKCSTLFMSKLDLQTHKGGKCEQNAMPDALKDVICCSKCKATFNTVPQLKTHSGKCKVSGGATGSLVCNYCNVDTSFASAKELHQHKVDSHQGHGLKLFTCSVCGKCFDFEDERHKHQATHHANPRVEVPMADIIKKIGELPKPQQGFRERGFGSNVDVAAPFITELSATNGSHAFAIKIDTSSGKPKVTVGLDEPMAPNVATPVVSRIKAVAKGMQSTSSPPKLSISTGKATPTTKMNISSNKVGYVIGSLNLASAKPIGPQAGSIAAKKAAATVTDRETSKLVATKTSPRTAALTKRTKQKPKETPEAKEPVPGSSKAGSKIESNSGNSVTKQISTVVADKQASDSPPLATKDATQSKTIMIVPQKSAKSKSLQARIDAELGKKATVIYADPKPKPVVRRARKHPAPSTNVQKEVPVKTKMLQAMTPAGKSIFVPIALTQGIHVEPVEGATGSVVQCSECKLKIYNMQAIANHACARCMRCLTIMHSLEHVAQHICTGSSTRTIITTKAPALAAPAPAPASTAASTAPASAPAPAPETSTEAGGGNDEKTID